MSISLSLLAFRTWSCNPFVRAASCRSLTLRSVFELFGFTSRAIVLAWGTSSASSSSRLEISSGTMVLAPVTLPPGLARLPTKPRSAGSPTLKTIGIVEVALFAASAEGRLNAAITSTLRPTRSAAIAGSRS